VVLADYADALRDEPPFDRAPTSSASASSAATAARKPVAAALADFARQQRTVLTPRDMPLIAEGYYYRTLPQSTLTLYDAFTGSVEERRAGAR